MMQKPKEITPLPGLIPTLFAGFDLTTRHLWLLFIPILLDIFYWLGPRLSLRVLIERLVASWPQNTLWLDMSQEILAVSDHLNLFTSLSIPFIGVPALMSKLVPETTPITPPVLEIDNLTIWFVLFIGLSMVGVLLTAVYYSLVAQVVRQQTAEGPTQSFSLSKFFQRVLFIWSQLSLMGFGLLFGILILSIPVLLITSLFSVISAQLSLVALWISFMAVLWLIIFLGFIPHGLTLYGRSLVPALVESIHLVRLNLIPTLLLLFIIIMISTGMEQLMLLADDGSWLTLSSILGHAFISTAMLVATFIFYRDRYAILLEINRLLRTQELSDESLDRS